MNTQQQYNELSPRLLKAMQVLDSPERTPGEIQAWYPKYKQMFDEFTRLERKLERENKSARA